MKLLRLKTRKVKKLPLQVTLPELFAKKNLIRKGDEIVFYISETGELIIKKEGV